MGSLSNLYISQSFTSLLHLGNDGPVTDLAPGEYTQFQDGLGNSLGISVNSSGDISSSGYIYATNIFPTITTSSFNQYTSSTNIRLNNLESATSSYANSASVAAVDAAQQQSINSLNAVTASFITSSTDITALNQFTQSANIRLNNLESTSASVNISVSNLNTFSASAKISISALNSFTSSQQSFNASATSSISQLLAFSSSLDTNFVTEAELAAATGSLIAQINTKLDTASFNTYTASQSTASIVTSINNINQFTSSANVRLNNLESTSASVNTSINNINQFTSSQLSFNASATASIVALQQFSSSLDSGFVTEAELAAATASLIAQINTKLNTSSFNSYTQSNDQRVSSLEVNSASVNVSITNINSTTASLNSSVSKLNTATQSLQGQLTTIGGQSGSWVTESETASFARYDVNNPWSAPQTFTTITASNALITNLHTLYETSSVIYSSGSNQFGDAGDDVQTLYGSVRVVNELTASGLNYPTADNGAKSFIQTDGAGNLSLQYVQTVYETIRNMSGALLPKGTPVYISGSTGDNGNAYVADASDIEKMPAVYIAGETLGVGATGLALLGGKIEGVDTSLYPAGTIIYVAEGGGWTDSRPSGSNSVVQVLGVVQKQGVGGQGVVINQLEAVLPNIQTGYVWVGNGSNQPVAVATSSIQSDVSGLVTTASFNAYTASNDQRVSSLEVNSASVNTSISNINTTTASLLVDTENLELFSASALVSISNLNQSSASQQISIDALNVFTASQSTASIVTSIDNLNTFTSSAIVRLDNLESTSASVNISISNLNSATSSYVTETESGSFLITASFDNGTRNLTFTKGDASTFVVNIPDVSGSGTIDTGSFATTGSNTFTGDQTFIDAGGNFFTISDTSGSLMLVGKSYTSASAHLSSSVPSTSGSFVNIIWKTNNNTADTIISGSNNIFPNPTAPTAGFKRYLTAQNIFLGAVIPQISASMQFSPTISGNVGGVITLRGPVSASVMSVNNNISANGAINLGTSPVSDAKGLVGQTTINQNFVAGTLNIIANQSNIQNLTNVTQNNINGGVTLNLNTSATIFSQNTINDVTFQLQNTFSSGSVGTGQVSIGGNTIAGISNTFTITGSQTVASTTLPGVQTSTVLGTGGLIHINSSNSRVSGTNIYHQVIATGLIGQRLSVTGSSFINDQSSYGSVFVGRLNVDDGIKNKTSDVVFAVGTGTSTSNRKTGFLIDSGSNTFVEGTLNVSGATSLNGNLIVTGSLTASLQEGYVWVGDSTGKTVTVATSSFGGASLPSGLLSSSVTDFDTYSASVDSRINSIVTGTGFATTGSNSFNGNQIITGSLTSSLDIIVAGVKMGFGNAGGTSSIAIGVNTLLVNTGNRNIAIGTGAGQSITTASDNTMIGSSALQNTTTGGENTAVGYNALSVQTTAIRNAAFGADAGRDNTGNNNVFIGWTAGLNAGAGAGNCVIGQNAGRGVKSSNNTILGQTAATNISSGSNNTIIGQAAGNNVGSGSNNTFLGQNAGRNISGSNNIVIGGAFGVGDWNSVIAISDGAANIKYINSGSQTTLVNNTLISGSLTTTGSATIGSVLQLTGLDPLPAGATGQLAVSASLLWFYDATQWRQVSLV